MRFGLSILMAALTVAPAAADVTVQFVDASPDRISFMLDGDCETGPATLSLDLTGSRAGLLIDMIGGGSIRTIEVISGAELVTRAPVAAHGDTAIDLDVMALVPSETVAFTIDLDDTASVRSGLVRDWEIEGVIASITVGASTVSAEMGRNGRAVIPFSACLS